MTVQKESRRIAFPRTQEIAGPTESDQGQRQEFSLEEESVRWGIPIRPSRPTLVVFLGTTALRIGFYLDRLLVAEFGRMPLSVQLLGIEISTEAVQGRPFPILTFGRDGAGTAASQGTVIIIPHAGEIADQCSRQAIQLSHTDPRAPASCSPDEGINVWFVSGSGGVGAGCIQPVVTATHAGLRHYTREVVARLFNIGPEISLRDVNRSPSANQELLVPENAANNWTRSLGDFRSASTLVEELPGLEPFSLRAQDRLASLMALDRSNGRHTIATVDDFIPMAARQFLLTALSPADGWISGRVRDLDVPGDTYRGRVSEPVFGNPVEPKGERS